MEEELLALIIQLKSLCLRETRILEQLRQTRAQETRVIQQIEGTRECRHQAHAVVQQVHQPAPPPPPLLVVQEEIIQADPFVRGQHVHIHNEVRRCQGQAVVTENNCRATVTGYNQLLDKVSIVTNNSFHTWRLSDNLCPLG